MLAVAAVAHSQGHTQILIILAAIALAMFWRAALKIGLALIVVVVALVIVTGDMALIHALRLLIP